MSTYLFAACMFGLGTVFGVTIMIILFVGSTSELGLSSQKQPNEKEF